MTDPASVAASSERGSATLAMIPIVLVIVLLAFLVADAAVFLGARGRAQVAADAAALAAAPVTFRAFGSSGSATDEAREFAARNGGQLVECRCGHDASWRPREVTVLVEIPIDLAILRATEVRAWSSAEFVPTDLAE